MKIVTAMTRHSPAPSPIADGDGVAIHASEAGTAILTFTRDRADRVEVSRIDRLPAGLDPSVRWLLELFPAFPATADAWVVIDADGLGRALWDRLNVHHRRGWALYDRTGRDRQELVNGLLVAQSERRIRILPSTHGDAVRKALTAYRRTVGEDGVIGGELVVALALAVVGRRPAVPRVM